MSAATNRRSAFGSGSFADAGRFLSLIVGARAMLETRGERAASASALIFMTLFTPRPRQKASNSSSNRAISVRREANRVRIAARNRSGRSAIGLVISRAASCAQPVR